MPVVLHVMGKERVRFSQKPVEEQYSTYKWVYMWGFWILSAHLRVRDLAGSTCTESTEDPHGAHAQTSKRYRIDRCSFYVWSIVSL